MLHFLEAGDLVVASVRRQLCGFATRHTANSVLKRGQSAGANYLENNMGTNKDQVKGKTNEAKGKIKEVAGNLVGNEKLEEKGRIQKNLGKAQAKYGDIKDAVKG
jgi:uncharacterized protein YjbJ (UPF0337 family)